MAVTSELVDDATRTGSSGTTSTVSSASFGSAFAGRVLVVAMLSNAAVISAVTIGGVSATLTRVASVPGGIGDLCLASAVVPTGTSGNIVATLSTSDNIITNGVVALTGASSATPSDTITNGSGGSGNIDVGGGGSIVSFTVSIGSGSWTGVTDLRTDNSLGAPITTAAFDNSGGALTNRAVSYSGSSSQGMVAAAFEASGTATRTNLSSTEGNSGSTHVSGSFTPPNNSLLVAVYSKVGNGTYGSSVSSVSGGGLTWTKRLSVGPMYSNGGSPPDYYLISEIWTAPVTTGSSMTVSASDGYASGDQSYILQVVGYTAYDSSSPTGASVTRENLADTGALSITLSASPANTSEVIAGRARVDHSGYNTSATPGVGWTEIYDVSRGGGYNDLQTQARSGSTSTTVAWVDVDDTPGNNNLAFQSFALEIKGFDGGGGGGGTNLSPSAAQLALTSVAPSVVVTKQFGELLGTLQANNNTIPTNFSATGSVPVSVGDLIVSVVCQQTALTVTGVTDNLGNTYTAQNAGTDAGAVTGRVFYSIVTTGGTLTSVTAACTTSANDGVHIVGVFKGQFSSIDANVANITSDVTSPFSAPSSGTLAQASEVVIAWGVGNHSTSWSATSPNLLAIQLANSTTIKAALGYQTVSSTSAVAPAFTAGSNPTNAVLGTLSFRQGGSSNISPGSKQLVLSTVAPSVVVSNHRNISPSAAQLALSAVAPSVSVAAHVSISPAGGQLVLSSVAPTVAVTQNVAISPAAAQLVLSSAAPSVARTAHVAIQPGKADLVLSTATPAVVQTTGVNASPATAQLSLSTTAPTVARTTAANLSPAAAQLQLSSAAPSVSVPANVNISPAAGQLALSRNAPAVTQDVRRDIPAGNLTLTAAAPTVVRTDHRDISPAAGQLVMSTTAPGVQAGGSSLLQPAAANLVLTGTAPIVAVTDNQNISPAAGNLVLSSAAPSVARTDHRDISVGAGQLTLSSVAPGVQAGASRNIQPAAANLVLSTAAPTVSVPANVSISPPAAQLSLSSAAPGRVTDYRRDIPQGNLTLSSAAPAVAVSASQGISPAAAQLLLTGTAPAVTIQFRISPAAAQLVLSRSAPSVVQDKPRHPLAGQLTLTTTAPIVSVTGHSYLYPAAAELVLSSQAPTVAIASTEPPRTDRSSRSRQINRSLSQRPAAVSTASRPAAYTERRRNVA